MVQVPMTLSDPDVKVYFPKLSTPRTVQDRATVTIER